MIIGLIRVTSCLLDRQLRHLEQAFIKEGGLRDELLAARDVVPLSWLMIGQWARKP